MRQPPNDADKATLRLEAAIQRHAGWQLEYDFALVVRDRKRLLARIAELEDADRYMRSLIALLQQGRVCRLDETTWCREHDCRPCPHAEAEAFLLK